MHWLLVLALAGAPNPQLHDELVEMARVDQEARQTADWPRIHAVDAHNTARMKAIVDQVGWPGSPLVGEDGAHAAWLLVQHADADHPFQQRCLLLMRAAVERHEASGQELAYLTDRVLTGQGKPQRYGTQFMEKDGKLASQPIDDPAHVDERRKAVGLGTLAQARADIEAATAERHAREAAAIKDPALAKRLVELAEADRKESGSTPGRQAHGDELRGILRAHGWPTLALVGTQGEEAAWSVLMDGDRSLQADALPYLEAAFDRKEVLGFRYATLADYVETATVGRQHFGTVYRWDGPKLVLTVPLDEPDRIDAIRAEVGLPPLEETMKSIEAARKAAGR